ncbi:MAG: RNA polymerase sigma factor [Agrococcus casei]|uniref:RNA polymerase sigma factor n=1 Tax=Agrococcus casei TaxID=343512 RepID=UPI003F92EC40
MNTHTPFEAAVQAHGATVLRVCRAVLGPHADADDAWSETFLSAMQAWPKLPESTNVEAWLVRIAHRKAIDVTRRRARQAVPVEHLPETPAAAGSQGRSQSDARSAERHELWSAVGDLPEKQRKAIAYRYLGSLPYDDIAELLGGTATAARRSAADGLQSLRRHPAFRDHDGA